MEKPGHRVFMTAALAEAVRALETGDVPVGAVAVYQGEIIASGRNKKEAGGNPLDHAEMICLHKAIRKAGFRAMGRVTLYVTLEPCAMCAGAMVLARLGHLVYGTPDAKAGAAGSVMDIARHPKLNHRIPVISGILQQECRELLKSFFKELRRRKKSGEGRTG